MNSKTLGLAIVAFAIIGIAVFQYSSTQKPQGDAVTTQMTATPTDQAQPPRVDSMLKDGTYTSTGHYQSPEGEESLGVKLQIKNNTIVTAEVTVVPSNDTTARFQGIFKDAFAPQVVGKDIRTLKLEKVAASSLTPKGFNDAVAQIVKQAQG